ncbi:MAG TPA: hypothetical protein VF752_15515 [Thermoleophilaceae bacterium]
MRVKKVCLLAVLAALACLGSTASAEAGRTVPQGFFGTVLDGGLLQAPAGVQDAQLGRMSLNGVESIRTSFSWAAVQPNEGAPPDFASTDRLVASAAVHGLSLLPVVVYAPAWARADASAFNSPPRDPEQYAAFLTVLIGRYGPSGSFWQEHPELPKRPLREWQIWNEPHLRLYWNSPRWEQGYGALLRASRRAIRAADPRAKVVLAGLTGFSWDALAALYRSGHIRHQFDVAALQTYTGPPRLLLKATRLFRQVLARHGDARTPIWITEFGWPAARGRTKVPSYQRNIATTDRGMAQRLSGAYRLFAAVRSRPDVRVERLYWYTWSAPYTRSNDPGTGIFRFAGLNRYDGSSFRATPALRAYRTAARSLEGCVKTQTGSCR